MHERTNVLTEATAAPAEAGVEEPGTDSLVQSDAGHNFGHFGADTLADVRDFVREADLHREEGVRGVLNHFRAGDGSRYHRDLAHGSRARGERRIDEFLVHERAIEIAHDFHGLAVFRSDYDAVGVERVMNGGAFAKKLRVAGHAETDRF